MPASAAAGPRALAAVAVLAATGLCACGSTSSAPPSALCTGAPSAIERALAAAPGSVRLRDGSSVSTCVAHAVSDAQLQNVGASLTPAADELARRAGGGGGQALAAATQLGYLVGAVRRGAARSNGISAELARRVEQASALARPNAAAERALATGAAAGSRFG